MCDFCENGKPLIDTRENEKRDTFLYVKKFLGKWYIDYTGIGSRKNMAEIFFCPMCGRKLSEETEKTNLRDKIIEKIKQTEPDYINYRDFYTKYGRVIPGIGDKWHWFENLTDEAKREGLLQITDMSDTELFDLYARINEDWKKTHSNQFWEDYKKKSLEEYSRVCKENKKLKEQLDACEGALKINQNLVENHVEIIKGQKNQISELESELAVKESLMSIMRCHLNGEGVGNTEALKKYGIDITSGEEEPLLFSSDEYEEDRIDKIEKVVLGIQGFLKKETEQKIKELEEEQERLMREMAHQRLSVIWFVR